MSQPAGSFLSKGLPLVLFMVGGSYGLSTFVQGRVDAKDLRYKSQSKRQYTLEQEHERAMEKLGNLDDYKMVPVPKPGS